MILVISNITNEAATTMVEQFPKGAASLITASDFNTSLKAAVSVNDFSSSLITIKQKKLPAQKITGIISTVPYFLPQEFVYIEEADRNYVCTEMNAFFIYFLSQLKCTKLNPPSVKTLTGLSLHKFEWLNTVRKLNVPIWPFAFKNGVPVHTKSDKGLRYSQFTLIGDTIIGDNIPDRIPGYMSRIADAFALPYLTCVFATVNDKDYFLWEILSVPNIDTTEHREAIVNYFLKSA